MAERAHSKRLRTLIFKRDGGICAKCGLDTERLIDIAVSADLRPSFTVGEATPRELAVAYWLEVYTGAPWKKKSLWDADHIIPVEEWPEGAPGLNDYRNLQLLCASCHQNKTSDHAARRAKRRKQRKKVGPKELQMREGR